MLAEIAGGVASSALSIYQAEQASRDAKMMAREQMQFQERMSNTAYQRSADDMEKAGLNRILSIGSAASTPSGASSGGYQGNISDFGQLASSAKQNATAKKQQEQQDKGINSQVETNKTQQDVNRALETKALSDSMASQQSAKRTEAETKILNSQLGEAETRAKLIRDNPWLVTAKEAANLVGTALNGANTGAQIFNALKPDGGPSSTITEKTDHRGRTTIENKTHYSKGKK
ncbi:MAG: DNA pilot protein [Wigfec virus K19_151]|nr:MAG: DNA pilot protein [Wigfec virus K19_151]